MWTFFSLGGFIAALLLPLHMVVASLAPSPVPEAYGIPFLKTSFSFRHFLYENPYAFVLPLPFFPVEVVGLVLKLYLVALLGGTAFHGLHRFKYTLFDFGLRKQKRALNVVLYGIAFAVSGMTFLALFP